VTATNNATNVSTGALQVAGGLSTGSDAHVGGNLRVHSATDASNASSGAMVVDGGLGVGGKAYVGGDLIASANTASTGVNSGALQVKGGAGVAGALYVGGDIIGGGNLTVAGSITGSSPITIAATNTPVGDKTMTVSGDSQTTGNMYVGGDVIGSGGLQIVGDTILTGTLYTGGDTTVDSGTVSTSTGSGALMVVGGVGVTEALHADSLFADSTVDSTTIGAAGRPEATDRASDRKGLETVGRVAGDAGVLLADPRRGPRATAEDVEAGDVEERGVLRRPVAERQHGGGGGVGEGRRGGHARWTGGAPRI
jgi:hypothetical protein